MDNSNRKVAIEITDLKKYFPVKSSSFASRNKIWEKANDGITLKIYEGENTRRHLYTLLTNYLLKHTPPNY